MNAEEDSLNKLITFFTTQASLGNMPHVLHDNLLQQKMMVDDRLKRTQEQKILFQVWKLNIHVHTYVLDCMLIFAMDVSKLRIFMLHK